VKPGINCRFNVTPLEVKMQKWEYCLVQQTFPDTRKAQKGKISIRMKAGKQEHEIGNGGDFYDTIEMLGEDGWNFVNATSHFGYIQYIFIRPKQEYLKTAEHLNSLELPPELSHEISEREKELREKILESYAKDT
jgi:hypothetical protein